MPVPSAISDLSTTPGLNSPSGSESPSTIDDYLRTHAAFIRQVSDSNNSSNVKLTGDQTIAGIKTFSNPIVGSVTGSAANVTGTVAIANGGTGQTTAAGIQSILPIQQSRADVASAATVNLTSSVPSKDHINITGTTAITAFTVAAGRVIFVRFAASLTLTNNANINTNTGANIVTAAGDTCIIRATSADAVEVMCYVRSLSQSLGDGQTWQNVTGSRALATNYTNTTGRSIAINVTLAAGGGQSSTLTVGGLTLQNITWAGSETKQVFGIVPPGAVYQVTLTAGSLIGWTELR